MKYNLLNAVVYEFCLSIIDVRPSARNNVWIRRILAHCFQDWVEWKTERTMKDVDHQVEDLHKLWKEQENKAIVEKFQEVYPEAKVTLHDSNTGAVFIEHPPDGSRAQDLLGGAMEIKSLWSLPPNK